MTDFRTAWEQDLLERAAKEFTYPATPSLRAGVMARLDAPVMAAPRWRPVARVALAAALVILIAGGAAVATSGAVRDAVAGFLGLAVEGETIELAPTPRSGETLTPVPPPLDLASVGTPAAPADVAGVLGGEPHLPMGTGMPRATFVISYEGLPAVLFRFEGYDLWQFRVAGGGLTKQIFFGAGSVTETRVRDVSAYWISGGLRVVTFHDANGREITGAARSVTQPALVWTRDGVYYRLEGDLPRERALAIAESIP